MNGAVSMCKGDGGAVETVSQGRLRHIRLVATLRYAAGEAARLITLHALQAAINSEQFGTCRGQTRFRHGVPLRLAGGPWL